MSAGLWEVARWVIGRQGKLVRLHGLRVGRDRGQLLRQVVRYGEAAPMASYCLSWFVPVTDAHPVAACCCWWCAAQSMGERAYDKIRNKMSAKYGNYSHEGDWRSKTNLSWK